jgi:hypothetical protein
MEIFQNPILRILKSQMFIGTAVCAPSIENETISSQSILFLFRSVQFTLFREIKTFGI